MDCAEQAIRSGGYAAFSFRTIAEHLEIKSASVHYHFPTKDALVLATVDRYTKRFFDAIGSSSDSDAIAKYLSVFKAALSSDFTICLCGVLASEGGLLTEDTQNALESFTEDNITWLTQAFEAKGISKVEALGKARVTFCLLEGSIIFSSITGKPELLDEGCLFVANLDC